MAESGEKLVDGIVRSAKRNDADRTTWAVDHFDVFRQQVFDAVFEDGMCVSAAYFHQL